MHARAARHRLRRLGVLWTFPLRTRQVDADVTRQPESNHHRDSQKGRPRTALLFRRATLTTARWSLPIRHESRSPPSGRRDRLRPLPARPSRASLSPSWNESLSGRGLEVRRRQVLRDDLVSRCQRPTASERSSRSLAAPQPNGDLAEQWGPRVDDTRRDPGRSDSLIMTTGVAKPARLRPKGAAGSLGPPMLSLGAGVNSRTGLNRNR